MGKRTPIGEFIHTTWINLNVRCPNGRYYRNSKKNSCYKNINLDITREEFKTVCLNNKLTILSMSKPSIDRINKNDDYTLDNIQFIELKDNIIKDHTKFKNGIGTCFKCKKEKPEDQFRKDNRRSNGRSTLCKMCDNHRKKRVFISHSLPNNK